MYMEKAGLFEISIWRAKLEQKYYHVYDRNYK